MKDRNVKQVLLWAGTSGGGGEMEKVKEGEWIWWMFFAYVYEDRTMKSVKILLSKEEGMRENDDGMNLSRVHCKHAWKCHSETLNNFYMLIIY
jgi:hypothetical protein